VPDPEAAVDGVRPSGPPTLPTAIRPVADLTPSQADFIFVPPEEANEDVFGRSSGNLLEPPPQTAVVPADLNLSTGLAAAVDPLPPAPPPAAPALMAEPHPAPPPEPEAAPANPWAQDEAAPESLGDAAEAGPVRAPRPKPRLPASFWILSFALPWAVAATAAAVMLYLRPVPRAVHPLESIEDQGPYEDVPEGGKRITDPIRTELPRDVPPVKLGETRKFGGIEVTPLEVLRQKVVYAYADGAADTPSADECLVLRLKIKNVSSPAIIFHPNDPTFNRAREGSYTYLQVGEQRFYGLVADPTVERLQGQNFGELLPGQALETIVVAAKELPAKAETAVQAVAKAAPGQALVWRVHLRKGREEVATRGRVRKVWVTTVVPVTFTAGDLKAAAAPATAPELMPPGP
jgi:hypothetical protein